MAVSQTISKEQAVEILKQIASIKALQGKNQFEVIAFENAARILSGHPSDLKTLIETGELETLKGIGHGHIARILHEFYEKGQCLEYEQWKKGFPPGLFDLFNVPGLGAKRIKLLYEKLSIKSLDELEKACKENRLLSIEGLGSKTQENILQGVDHIRQTAGQFLISTAMQEADRLVAYFKKQKGLLKIEIAGSVRRRMEIVHDIDILISANDPAAMHQALAQYPDVSHVLASGETKSSVLLKSDIQCDLRTVEENQFAAALYYFTGSKEHHVVTRTMAKKHNIKINEYGVFKNDQVLPIDDERGIFKVLGLHFIPPELRENMGEIEWAASKDIPKLLEQKDIRGVFHVHTDYSDGTASLGEMIAQAQELGFEYIGISDHSRSAYYAGGLDEERLGQQHKEIQKLQKSFKIRIFHGIESEILADGSLDYPDSVLEGLDFVVGSVHSSTRQPKEKMTQRMVRAMKNKYLTFLGHPTGRLLLQRPGYEVDLGALYDCARDHGVVIEVNANPSRLDLDWRHLRQVKQKGILLAINPDAHALEGFKDIMYGVGVARKGWLEAKDVVNTLSLAQIEKFLLRRKISSKG